MPLGGPVTGRVCAIDRYRRRGRVPGQGAPQWYTVRAHPNAECVLDTHDWPTVTVAIVTYNSIDDLKPCLQSVLDQDYPAPVEIMLVDNASTDGSVELVKREFPQVQLVENRTNTGFAPAVNQAARAGEGEMLVLLNNDAIAQPEWLTNLIDPFLRNPDVRCTGGLVLDGDGRMVDFAGGELTFYGHGIQAHSGEVVPKDLRPEPTIFVTGASLATPREFFLEAGGLDEDYFAFFEDVDYGWRVWVLGYETWFVPDAVVHHRGHGTITRLGNSRWRYLLERNALFTIFKNYGDDLLSKTLPAAMLTTIVRAFHDEDPSDIGDYRIGSDTEGKPEPTPHLTSMAGAHIAALRDFGLSLDSLRAKREEIQKRRGRSDDDIAPLFRQAMRPNGKDASFLSMYQQVVDGFNLPWPYETRQRVLIVTADTLGERMAGPAIRVWEMASLLSRDHDVRVVSMRPSDRTHERFRVGHITPTNARFLATWATIIITQGGTLHHFPELGKSEDTRLVIDLYDPFHIEMLVLGKDEPQPERWTTNVTYNRLINEQLERGDLLLCASEKQRTFWLGQLAGIGRVNPATYDEDPDLRGLLRVASFGLPPDSPKQKRHALRAADGGVEGIGEDDIVLLWGGGIYDWFDPVTLLRGLAEAVKDEPRLKLFFLGTAHPNPDVPDMPRVREARDVAEELGLTGTHVFFNDGWVAYEDRADYLLDANIGVSTHFRHLETELSYRTRILDYLWAGLPIITTDGDSFADLVRTHDLGEVVRAEDPSSVAQALRALADPDRRARVAENIRTITPTMTWERTLRPLVDFCRMPRKAADLDVDRARYIREGSSMFRRSPAHLAKTFVVWAQDKGLSSAVRAGINSLKVRRAARREAQ